MSTTTNAANFRTALDGYHDALGNFATAIEQVQEAGLARQRDLRSALQQVNEAVLAASGKAVCVIRATVDAQVLDIDNASGAQPAEQNRPSIRHATTTLQARRTVLDLARTDLQAAMERLGHLLNTIEAAGAEAQGKLESLSHCDD